MPTTDYAALAKSKIRKPGERKPRMLVYGQPKKGKTTFGVSSGERTLVIDPEYGADFVKPDHVEIWDVTTWAELNEVYQYLRTGKHPYKWVVVDGLTKINNMALRYVMAQQEERDLDRIPGIVQQRDYGRSGELMKGMLYNFHALDVGIVYTAQDRVEQPGAFEGGEDDDAEDAATRWVPDLPKGIRGTVNSVVDVIGRIYTVRVEGTVNGKEIKATQRRLYLGSVEKYDTGFRSVNSAAGMVPFVKQPTIPKVVAIMRGTTNG